MDIAPLPTGNWLFASPDLPDECLGLQVSDGQPPMLSVWRRGPAGCGEPASPAISVPLTRRNRGTHSAFTGQRPTHTGPQPVEILLREVIDDNTAIGAVRVGNHAFYEVVLTRTGTPQREG